MGSARAPTADDFLRALREIGPLHENHVAILRHHAQAPDHTMTMAEIAAAVGYNGYKAANLQYGLLAARIGSALNQPGARIGLLVEFTAPNSHGNPHWELTMRPELAQAVADMVWI